MNFWNILFAQKHGASPTGDFFEELLAGYTKPSEVKTLTGIPPLTFVSDGSNLKNWAIFGNDPGVGERTENLINVTGFVVSVSDSAPGPTSTKTIWQGTLETGTYTMAVYQKTVLTSDERNTLVVSLRNGFVYENAKNNYHLSEGWHTLSFTVDAAQTVALYLWTQKLSNDCEYNKIMLIKGSTAPSSYIPYGYKIPVETRERSGNTWNVVHITNIYTQTQLGTGDTITKEQTGVDIPTVDGNNTLTVGTTVQPSSMTIVYNGK
jgi:hypothetical protein